MTANRADVALRSCSSAPLMPEVGISRATCHAGWDIVVISSEVAHLRRPFRRVTHACYTPTWHVSKLFQNSVRVIVVEVGNTGPMIRIGTSGWVYPPWRGQFYPRGLPQRRELEYISRKVNSVEINGSFYSLQRPERYLDWVEQTPDDFLFSVKGG